MCKYYYYMRISTQTRFKGDSEKERQEFERKEKEQTFDRQVGIFTRAGYELNDDNTFAERISGKTKADEREQFEKMLSVLEQGDYVVFTETSRFSRSYLLGMQMLDTLIFDKKVNVKFVSNGIELFADSRWNPYTWYTVSQMLLADELQRRIISYNTVNGLQRKKEQGMVLGAKKKEIPEEMVAKVKACYLQGENIFQTCKKTGISRRLCERLYREFKELEIL